MKNNLIITLILFSGLALQAGDIVERSGGAIENGFADIERGAQKFELGAERMGETLKGKREEVGMPMSSQGELLFEENVMIAEEPLDEIDRNALEVQN